ncbi:MAG: hypothetical protein WD690_15505 [Vicinamibacterales bacterium]
MRLLHFGDAPGVADECWIAGGYAASALARINAVNVISSTSALQFAGTPRPLTEIASALNARAVVEGSVVTDGPIVRVRTRIVDGSTDFKSAVRDFEGRRDDIEALQRQIAIALSATFQARNLR